MKSESGATEKPPEHSNTWTILWQTNRKHATIVTLHLFKQAIWEDTWKLTFEKITHMQLMWLCICSTRRFEKTFENHLMEKFRTTATIVTLHLLKQAIWEDMCNLAFGEIAHMQLLWLLSSIQAGDLKDKWQITFEKIAHNTTNVTLHLFNQAIWEDVWK